MFVLGILLLLIAAAIVVWVVLGLNGEANNSIHFDWAGITADLKPLTLFALGALTLLLIWLATRLFAAATKKKYRKRKERKANEKEHARLERERDELAYDRDNAAAERDRLARERDLEHENRETAEAKARVWERDARDAELRDDTRVERGHGDHRVDEVREVVVDEDAPKRGRRFRQ